MMNYQLTVDWEEIQSILQKELLKDYQQTVRNIKAVKSSGQGFVFSNVAKTDLIELKKLKHSLECVLNYYGVDVENPTV